MSILLTAAMDVTWYGSTDRGYMTEQSIARATGFRVRGGTGRFLVAGHGYGHLVNALIDQGIPQAWGVDLSDFALTQSKATYPAISTRFVKGDCRVSSQMATARQQTIGGPNNNNNRYDVIVGEDILSACGPEKVPPETNEGYYPYPAYTAQDWIDAKNEALAIQTALRSILRTTGTLAWLISMREPGMTVGYEGPGLWLTGEEWRQLLGPTDYIERIRDGATF